MILSSIGSIGHRDSKTWAGWITRLFCRSSSSGHTRCQSLTSSMSWTRPARSWFSSAFRTRPARAALRQFSTQGSPTATQHSLKTLLFSSLTAGLVGFTIAKSFPTLGQEGESNHSQFGSSDDFKKAIQELQSTFPANNKVSVDPDDLHVHGFSANDHHPGMYEQNNLEIVRPILSSHLGVNHSVVVYPECTNDVVKIVKIANKYRMPIVPYAGATSLEGQYRGVWHCYTLSHKLDANPSSSSILLGVSV